MNPLVPTPVDGAATAVAIAALLMSFVAFASLVRRGTTSGGRFLLWVLFVFFVPVVGAVSWWVVGHRTRTARDRDGAANRRRMPHRMP